MNVKRSPEKYLEKRYPKRILIVKPSSLGDIAQSITVVSAILKKYPDAEISWVVNSQYAELLGLCRGIKRIILFERKRWANPGRIVKTLWEFRRFVMEIRALDVDVVLDMQGLFRSGLIAFLSGVKIRVGFEDAREGAALFYTHRVSVPKERSHAVERYLTIAEYIGCGYERPVLDIDIPAPNPLQGVSRRYIAVNIGARWQTKKWPRDKFIELLEKLNAKYKVDIVLVGDEDAQIVSCGMNLPIIDLTKRTNLKELFGVLAGCSLVITNDSGPMHMACLMAKPVVALYGPSDPSLTGPWGSSIARVVKSNLSCSPCFKRRCPLPSGRIECMESITVCDVMQAVENVLQKAKGVI